MRREARGERQKQLPVASCQLPVNSKLKIQNSKLYFALVITCSLLATCLLVTGCSREEPYPFPVTNTMQDKDILKTILQEALKAYESENLNRFMSFWSKQSPQYRKQEQMAKDDFNALKNITIKYKDLKVTVKNSEAVLTFHQTFSADFFVPVPVQDRVKGTLHLKKHLGRYKVFNITLNKINEKEKITEVPVPLSKMKPRSSSEKEILNLTGSLLEFHAKPDKRNFHPESPLLKNTKVLQPPEGLAHLTVDVYSYSVREKNNQAQVDFAIRRSATYPVSKKVSDESKATLICEKRSGLWKIVNYKARKLKKNKHRR